MQGEMPFMKILTGSLYFVLIDFFAKIRIRKSIIRV